MKTCSICGEEKSKDNFFFRKEQNRLRADCKSCANTRKNTYRRKSYEKQRNQMLKDKYGLTTDDYNTLYNKQCGCCKICGRHQSELKLRLSVDHNHSTGIIRGLLCHACNVAIGLLKEKVDVLKSAIEYLEEDIENAR